MEKIALEIANSRTSRGVSLVDKSQKSENIEMGIQHSQLLCLLCVK